MGNNNHANTGKQENSSVSYRYVLPFLIILAVLTVISFIIPLRPTKSYAEKRSLAQFPTFSLEALSSGQYFDEINLWFSDTFPGRETWLNLSSSLSELHGYSEISISGDLPSSPQISVIPPAPTAPPPEEHPDETIADTTEMPTEETVPETAAPEVSEPEIIETAPSADVEEWGGVDAGNDAEIAFGGASIQIGDAVFQAASFSETGSGRYINMANQVTDALTKLGVRVVFAPAPTSVGILVSNQYQEKLHCAPQDEIIDYMFSGITDDAVKVDMFDRLVEHNSEYLYFRTDHHWTARGAYYGYEQIMLDMGYEPLPLESFEEWDQGTMIGSLYGGASYPSRLTLDTLYAYIPPMEVSMKIAQTGYGGFDWPMIYDRSKADVYTKYMAFLSGDHALCTITNDNLPDGPVGVVVKDSYGNAMVPFLSQNYHKLYVIDYRKYTGMSLNRFVEEFQVDDVIYINNINATQTSAVYNQLGSLVK